MAKRRELNVLSWHKGPTMKDNAGDKVQTWIPSSPGVRLTEFGWTIGRGDVGHEDAFDIHLTPSVGTWEVVEHYDWRRVETTGDDEEGSFLLATELNVAAIRRLLSRK